MLITILNSLVVDPYKYPDGLVIRLMDNFDEKSSVIKRKYDKGSFVYKIKQPKELISENLSPEDLIFEQEYVDDHEHFYVLDTDKISDENNSVLMRYMFLIKHANYSGDFSYSKNYFLTLQYLSPDKEWDLSISESNLIGFSIILNNYQPGFLERHKEIKVIDN